MADEGEALPVPGVPFYNMPVEIQSQIGKLLDNKTLYNAIRVNKEWFDRLIDLLWHTTSIEKLQSGSKTYTSTNRRQIYARRIRVGTLKASDHTAGLLHGVTFQVIKRLEIQATWVHLAHEVLIPFLHPTLQHLTLNGSFYLTATLLASFRNCTELHTISFSGEVTTSDNDCLLKFLGKHKPLRSLTFGGYLQGASGHDITLSVAEVLLRRGDLVHLSLRRPLIEYLGETHTETNPQSIVPLPTNTQLQSLSIIGKGPVVAVFLSVAAASLQHLTLSLDFPSDKIFDQVSVLTDLVHLSLNWRQNTKPMTSDQFDAVCALENLKYLCLGWRSEHRATLGWLTDDKLADWISHFACLHTLQLDWEECSLTEASIVAISRSCPDLITCNLGWKHNLDEWKSLTEFAPLFPKLKALQLGKVEHISFAAPLVRYFVKSMQLIDVVF